MTDAEPSPEALARVRDQYGAPIEAPKRPASGQLAALSWIAVLAWILTLVLAFAVGIGGLGLTVPIGVLAAVATVGAVVLAGVRELLPRA